MTVLSEFFNWSPFVGSLINIAAIAVERYLKVVHHVWAKKSLRKWKIYSAAAFAWIGGYAIVGAVTIHTTTVLNGVCYTLIFFKSRAAKKAFGIWYFVSFYLVLILIFIFCYWRILVTIRRQANVMAGHGGAGSSAAQTQSKHIQSKVIRTMLLVSLLFVVAYTPGFMYSLLLNVHSKLQIRALGYHIIVVIGFLYNCTNPFVYATNFDPVNRVLLGMIPCKKNTQPPENFHMS